MLVRKFTLFLDFVIFGTLLIPQPSSKLKSCYLSIKSQKSLILKSTNTEALQTRILARPSCLFGSFQKKLSSYVKANAQRFSHARIKSLLTYLSSRSLRLFQRSTSCSTFSIIAAILVSTSSCQTLKSPWALACTVAGQLKVPLALSSRLMLPICLPMWICLRVSKLLPDNMVSKFSCQALYMISSRMRLSMYVARSILSLSKGRSNRWGCSQLI